MRIDSAGRFAVGSFDTLQAADSGLDSLPAWEFVIHYLFLCFFILLLSFLLLVVHQAQLPS